MPYIPQERRPELERKAVGLGRCCESEGELNFAITKTLLGYLDHRDQPYRYADYNEVLGVVECVKQELYRRVVAPYEDRKCAENGDVYPPRQ